MNPIAKDLNSIVEAGNPHLFEMLSDIGKNLFFPKGILSQSAEAKEKAHNINATIGIAKESGHTMKLDSVAGYINDIPASNYLTYAPSFGIPDLRQAWKASLFAKNPSLAGKQISLPVATNGITHAIAIFADVWLDPGDVVILPEMMWGNYNLILTVRKGARIDHYELFNPAGGFNLDAFEECVRAAAAENDKITVLLNFPQNPSGYTATESEGRRIVEILNAVAAGGTNVLAVFDDAYFGLFYEDDTLKESLFARLCQSHPRLLAVKLDGATKENFVWGLRCGFITYGCPVETDPASVYDALERKTAGAVRGNISNCSHLGQAIILRSMQSDSYAAEQQEKFGILKARAERVKAVLADPKYAAAWDVYPFNSGYFMCLKLKTVDAEPLRVHLLDKYGVGLIA
ncbi:MAG: aminotransferase class I/II-fold pyridoxal phosphate-dependent enzyme, partial [Desulfobacterales bacterium]|nr:aminotransferase class I/II-fold pyridoxal phosphate-dependent enzyme [Desulfobacterales bacterium]